MKLHVLALTLAGIAVGESATMGDWSFDSPTGNPTIGPAVTLDVSGDKLATENGWFHVCHQEMVGGQPTWLRYLTVNILDSEHNGTTWDEDVEPESLEISDVEDWISGNWRLELHNDPEGAMLDTATFSVT